MKILELCVIIGAAVVMAGCGTSRAANPEVISTTTTETTVTTTVVETTTVSSVPVAAQAVAPAPTGDQPVPQGVDILQGTKKPCSTVAADAPKFVAPDKKK